MYPNRSTTISIQHKPIQRNGSPPPHPAPPAASDDRKSIWTDMNGWMEQRQREWDEEMAQLKNDFFSLKTPSTAHVTTAIGSSVDDRLSCRSSDDSGQELMSIGSSSCSGGGGRGLGDVSRGRTFRATFDVSQFKPDEIHVRTQENSIIVRAKHEEKHEKKSMSREFNRRVDIPTNVDPQTLQCFIREDGTLLVEGEMPPGSNESSLMENSSAHSVFSDRLSDGDTCSPPRTDREDAYSPSSLEWSIYRPRRELDRCSPSGIERDVLTPQRTEPDGDIYSWPVLDRDELQHIQGIKNFAQPTEYIDSRQKEYRNDLDHDLFDYQRGLDPVFPHSVQDRTLQNDRLTDPYRNRSELDRYSPNALDLDQSRQWHHLSTENGNNISSTSKYSDDPDVFSVVLDVGTDFEPHELAVKMVDNKLVVHAQRRNPYTGRQIGEDFYREFDLPYGIEPETITANLTSEGILIIEAPTNSWNYSNRSPYSTHDSYLYNS